MFTLTQRLPRPLLSVAIVSLDRHLACNISCGNVGFGCMLTVASGCHLRFWQNDRDLLRTTAVTRGWNGYRNKSQHRKLTLEKKIILPLLQGFELSTFQSQVRRSNH